MKGEARLRGAARRRGAPHWDARPHELAAPLAAILCLVLLLAAPLRAAPQTPSPAPERYDENVSRQIALMLSGGAELRLAAAIDAQSHGPAESAATTEAAEAERLRSLLTRDFSTDPHFTLVFLGSLAELAGGEAAATEHQIRALCAAKGGNLALIVRLESYEAGGGKISEVQTSLQDIDSGRELARDVVWTVVSSSGAESVFVNGARVK